MYRIFFLLLLWAANTAFADMLPMDNQDLSAVTGQDGVGITLEMRLNANANGSTKCGVSIPMIECRIGLAFNNRGTPGTNQEWLVMKGISGRIFIPYLAMDASTVTYGTALDGTGTQTTNTPAAKLGFDPANPIRISNLVISNMSVEMDTGATTLGYMVANETGFMGLRIDDSNSISTPTTPFLGIQVSGSVKIFPCSGGHALC